MVAVSCASPIAVASALTPPDNIIFNVEAENGDLIVVFESEEDAHKCIKSVDDPLLILDFDGNNISAGIAAVTGMINPPARPAWWVAGQLTIESVKRSVMGHLANYTSGGIQGTCMIAPNSLQECMRIAVACGLLNNDPFIQALRGQVNNQPLATLWFSTDRQPRSTCTRTLIPAAIPNPAIV